MTRTLRRCTRGATAVEFALILPLLLLFLVGSIETAINLFIGSSIELAVLEASRFGITGQEDEDNRAAIIRRIVDDRTYGLLDMDKVDIDTLVYDDFDDIGKPEPWDDANGNAVWDTGEIYDDVNENGQWDEDMGANGVGGRDAIMVYRVTYPWGVVTPMMQRILGRSVKHVSAIAVQNEPF